MPYCVAFCALSAHLIVLYVLSAQKKAELKREVKTKVSHKSWTQLVTACHESVSSRNKTKSALLKQT